jgi:hypothetical protein
MCDVRGSSSPALFTPIFERMYVQRYQTAFIKTTTSIYELWGVFTLITCTSESYLVGSHPGALFARLIDLTPTSRTNCKQQQSN